LTFVGFAVFFGIFFLPAEIGKLMASGDASVESIPALLGPHHLWEPSMLLGYPLYADPNTQEWYPLAWLARVPGLFNAFAIAPYPIAAFGMWGYVRSVTRSVSAGLIAGLVFALGGFMISHAGHLMITHPASWAPYVLWSIEAQRRKHNAVAIGGGAFAIGLCAVSGQPQVLAFLLALAVTYSIVSARAAANRRIFVCGTIITIAVGLGIGCVQLIPEAILAHSSSRTSLSFADFTIFEIPVSQLALRAIFPYALGVTRLPGYPFSGADLGAFVEDSIAVSIVALFLAFVSLAGLDRDRRILYWFGIAAMALLLAIGDATPLAAITYRMPIYALFRIPGRHAFEWTFAIAVLAGYGAAAIRNERASLRARTIAAAAVLLITGVAYLEFAIGNASAANFVATTFNVATSVVASPVTNGALGIPLCVGLFGTVLVWIASRFYKTRVISGIIGIAVLADAGTFAYAAYWNWGAVSPAEIQPAPFVAKLVTRLNADRSRVAWLPGNSSAALAPNLTTLWHVSTVDGYAPLVPTRATELLGATPSGGIALPAWGAVNLDIAGVSVIAMPAVSSADVSAAAPLAGDTLHLFLSAKFADAVTHADLGLTKPLPATSVIFVSELGDSVAVPQGADVASLTVKFTDRTSERHEILAGRDTSEFAFDRPDVRPLMKHARATIYSSEGPGHTYVSTFSVHAYKPIETVTIDWHYPSAALTLEKLSIIDSRDKSAHAFGSLTSLYGDRQHWKPIAIDPTISAFQNMHVLPHVWIARPIQSSSNVAATSYLRSGSFEPAMQAIVEEPIDGVDDVQPESKDTARLQEASPTNVMASITCVHACFVVDRDAFDSDWKADVDGRYARTYVTDIDLRGVVVPAGKHQLTFHFIPIALMVGATLTIISALCALALAFVRR
jgi:hypothetical protein